MIATAFAPRVRDDDIAGCFAARQLRIGLQHYAAGRIAAAISAYRHGLAAAGDEPPGSVPAETLSELHAKLGNACLVGGDLEQAAANYKAALRLTPNLTFCWCNLGNVQLKTGNARDAIAFYLQALKLDPAHWPSRTNLVQALMATGQYLMAKALLLELTADRPLDAQIHHQLGKACFELHETEAALGHFQQAAALDPRDADSLYWIGGIRQRAGDIEAAEAAYAAAAHIQPLIRRPAAKFPADFRVLALYGPFAGNTPTELLFRDAAYDTATLALFDHREHDVEPLKQDVDVVVNLISDADQGNALLPQAAALVRRLGKPTVNDPGRVLRTTRDNVAGLLRGIPGCIVPKVWRQKAGAKCSIAALRAALPASSSVLVRPVGTHGGDEFEKIESPAELAAILERHADSDRYLIEYIDYRSADGYFRKYRFIFVGNDILPYHLAIGSHWKLHHDNTDMVNQPWMQHEEESFLSGPAAVFNAGHYQALRAIRQRIGLDYFGIDCGLDRSGNLVVFEVNASMLVHDGNEAFPYKTPFVHRIKSAFDDMLREFANACAG